MTSQTVFSPAARERFRRMAQAADVDVLEAMLVLGCAINPEVDAEECRDRLDQICAELQPIVDDADGEADRVEAFVAGMRRLGFRGNTDHYYDARNTLISEVLERRTGIPISLAVLSIEVGRRIGVDLRGVGFPYHFLLKAVDVPGLYVDPFFGTTRDEASCAQLLDELSGGTLEFRPEFLRTVEGREIFVRVLRNLKLLHKNAGAIGPALEYCELILLFDPEQPAEYRDRGTISLALGEWNRAVDDLSTYLAMTPNAPDRPVVLGQLQWVLHQQNSVH